MRRQPNTGMISQVRNRCPLSVRQLDVAYGTEQLGTCPFGGLGIGPGQSLV